MKKFLVLLSLILIADVIICQTTNTTTTTTTSTYKCVDGTNGCSACAATKTACATCRGGWYLDATSKQCKQCSNLTSGCLACSDASTCTAVATGYVLISGAPVKCADGCLECSGKTAAEVQCTREALGFWLQQATAPATGVVPTACYTGCGTCKDATIAGCKTAKPGFFFDLGLGKCTVANCLKCGANRSKCTECDAGFFLTGATDAKTCEACSNNCATCASKTDCTTCKSGYRVNSTKGCDKCGVDNCSKCDADINSCQTCIAGFYGTTVCNKCADNCNQCAEANICDESGCISPYIYNKSTKLCGTGCSSNCTAGCANNKQGACDACDAGYGWKSSTDKSCGPCGQNCKANVNCDGNFAGKCDSCKDGYVLTAAFQCQACNTSNPGCTACSLTACTACDTQYVLDAASAKCVPCTKTFSINNGSTTGFDPNAKACSLATTTITVTDCMTGYILYNNAVCVKCNGPQTVYDLATSKFDTKATKCVIKHSVTVLTCADGHFLNTSGGCTACTGTGVKKCTSASVHTECNSEFYLNAQNTCTACGTGAATCNASGALTCKDTYFKSGTTCTQCENTNTLTCTDATHALTCAVGYGKYTADTTKCQVCAGTSSATACTSATVDTTCITAAYLKDESPKFTCTACSTGAATCDATGALTCKAEFYKSSTTCTACGTGAATCDATGALTCKEEYFKSSTTCTLCGTGALTCTTASAHLTCKDGYYLDSTCKSCVDPGAKTCKFENSAIVITACLTNFVLYKNVCFGCKVAATVNGIASTGFDANAVTCQFALKPEATECSSGSIIVTSGISTGVCASCTAATSVNGVQTTGFITNCQTCSISGSTISCSLCTSPYVLIGGACVQCDTNCKDTQCTEANKCTAGQCKTDFGINTSTGVCGACAANCVSCQTNGAGQCDTCKNNFYLTSTGNLCLACSDNCLSCSVGGQCTTCKNGYFKSGNTCSACYDTEKCTCTSNNSLFDCSPIDKWGKYFPAGVTLSSTTPLTLISACIANCVLCFGATVGECITAAPKFYLDATSIGACAANCEVCTGATADKCVTLSAGYYKETVNSTVSIKQCPNGCPTCTVSGTNVTCSSCPSDLGGSIKDVNVTTSFVCTYNCVSNCEKCTTQDTTGCSACKTGFSKDSKGACVSSTAVNNTNTTSDTGANLLSVFLFALIAIFLALF